MSVAGKQITDYSTLDLPPFLVDFFLGSDLATWEKLGPDVQFAQLENVFFDILNGLWLDLAVGAQLDIIGKHLNFSRNGLDDVSYRVLLTLVAYSNRGGGTINSLINLYTAILQASAYYSPMWNLGYPAAFFIASPSQLGVGTFYLLVDNNLNQLVDNLGNILQVEVFGDVPALMITNAIPAGVELSIGDDLVDNLGNSIVDNLGNQIVVLTPIISP